MSGKTSDAIGIDLGTTYSCCAVYSNGNIEVIPNLEGKSTTPSVVAFDDNNNKLVGDAALFKKTSDPTAVLYDAKRLIGRSFDDPELAKFMNTWSFKLVRFDLKNKCESSIADKDIFDNIRYKVKDRYHEPVGLSAYILIYLKEAAELKLNKKITKAVVTVPAHFKDSQRSSTKSAAIIAGFTEVRLLNEPTAAALAYGFYRGKDVNARQNSETVLVFDLGGGTFDVSCLKFESSTEEGALAETLATDGDTLLGGRDFDHEIYTYCVDHFCLKHKVDKAQISDKSKRRLRIEAEKAKRILSTAQSTTINVDYFFSEHDLCLELTRPKFVQLCEKYFNRAMERIKGCLMTIKGGKPNYDNSGCLLNEDKNLIEKSKKDIDRVLLVGGSSRIPCVIDKLNQMFGQEKVFMPVNPDEAVAIGAAYQAALILSSDVTNKSESLLLMDTTPMDIGVETAGGIFTPIIKGNSTIPTQKKQIFTTYSDNQTSVQINIYEGNRAMVKDNTLLGSFSLEGIPPAPRGVPQIEICCVVDHSGCLKVNARDISTSNKNELEITDMKTKLSDEDIERLKKEAEMFAEQDKKVRERVEKRNEYDSAVFMYKKLVDEGKVNDKVKANEVIAKHEKWLIENPEADAEDCQERIKHLQNEFIGLMQQGGGAAQPQGPEVEEVN
ncbi:hypothetical protein NQ315_014201 [Exocentrus adspersus]|uniref:Heat shock protein 70 n=1 Tax=Exocentrus adspersus TaxID=1586481 RepID=A0AAV8V6W9_9CUCU|nr:hypothetical protein NQ315_014201 [Exocentrus adspersus]